MPFAGTIPQDFPHFATGPTLVRYPPTYDLGYAEDRIQVQEHPLWHDVKSDGSGGSEGPPCDVQFLGAVVFVSCLLNRFKEANIRRLSRIRADGAGPDGTVLATGYYMRQDAGMNRLELVNKSYTLVYEKAFLRTGRQFSVGTRHQAVILTFECHVDTLCDAKLFEYDEQYNAFNDPCYDENS